MIAAVCQAIARQDSAEAASILKHEYPFAPDTVTKRRYGPLKSTRVFVRDGFLDRYTGDRLIFPPVLRLISAELPDDFPCHPNWKTELTHPAFWEVGATIDHLVPVTRGGKDDETNWVTTSMARNSAKMNWRVEELGWTLRPPGDYREWDGMVGWFLDYSAAHPNVLTNQSIRAWFQAARSTTANDDLDCIRPADNTTAGHAPSRYPSTVSPTRASEA